MRYTCLFIVESNGKSKHGCNYGQMNNQYCLLPGWSHGPRFFWIERVKSQCDSQLRCSLEVVFVHKSLVKSQGQETNIKEFIEWRFHVCKDKQKCAKDCKRFVRFDEIAGLSMGFLGVRQGNGGVLL